MKERLLVISPHPDDETLGCGGTLLRFKKEGSNVFWLNVTDMKEEYGFSLEQINKRKKEIEAVKEYMRVDEFVNLALRPMYLDQYPLSNLVSYFSNFQMLQPTTIIFPFMNDIHSEHRIVFQSAFSCTKIFRYPYIKTILMMEVISETDFAPFNRGVTPNYFIDISDFLKEKIHIMAYYKSEIGKHPFPRSIDYIKALAVKRGAEAGTRYAEAFILLKGVR